MAEAGATMKHLRDERVALRKLRQEDLGFKASLSYIARPCLKKKKRQVGDSWRMALTYKLN
jgi:hypothetical protein